MNKTIHLLNLIYKFRNQIHIIFINNIYKNKFINSIIFILYNQ